MRNKIGKIKDKAYHYGVQLVAVGALTGLFAGIAVTLYNVLANIGEGFSRDIYEIVRETPAFIPLLFLALFLGAIVIGGVVKFIPMIRGSGIPQTEGATRGLLHFRWYQVLTGMFAASLATIFLGLSAGSEGPSIQIGGACGYGTADLLKRKETVRRYQITGGACTGLAVAFNAPVTGMAFAFEEAHKRFTPEVFVCAFSSVIVGVITRNLLRPLLGFPVESTFTTFSFTAPDMFSYLYILLAALVCAFAGVAFYFLVFRAKKLFAKITFWKGTGKMLIPFMLAGIFGLITVYAMGGGHELIQALGSKSEGMELIFSSPLWATLLIVFAFKFIVSVVNMGAGVPCGVFIPMLAVGACLGALLSLLCVQMGMDPAYSDVMIMICMATFFTTIVKAPVTGIVMVVELTWSFTFLLPVVMGVAVGYLVGELFRTKPIYDRLLDDMLAENRKGEMAQSFAVRCRVTAEGIAAGRAVRDILFPPDVRILRVERGDAHFTPDGNTILLAGDVLTVEGEEQEGDEVRETLAETLGEEISDETDPR